MKRIDVEHFRVPESYVNTVLPNPTHYDQIVEGPAELVDERGIRVAALLDADPRSKVAALLPAVRRIKSWRANKRSQGLANRATRTFGYMPRIKYRQDYCTLCVLASDHPEIDELDLNPVMVSADGAFAADAIIRLEHHDRTTGPIRRLE